LGGGADGDDDNDIGDRDVGGGGEGGGYGSGPGHGPSGGYGPSPDSNSYFLYAETSNSVFDGKTAYTYFNHLLNPSEFSSLDIYFWYHAYGLDLGSYSLQQNSSGSWVNIWSGSGQVQTSETADWIEVHEDLSGISGEFGLRFIYSHVSGYRGDWSLDNITVVGVGAGGDYKLEHEVQFTDVMDFMEVEKVCIKTGSMGTENLAVEYWDEDSWETLLSDLAANDWNNNSVSLSGSTFTIRFSDVIKTSDTTTQDVWNINSVLLQYSGAGSYEDFVDRETSDVDGAEDLGDLTNFNNMMSIG